MANMRVRVTNYPSGTYVCIDTDRVTGDYLVRPSMNPVASLRAAVDDLHAQAARILRCADMLTQAADILQRGEAEPECATPTVSCGRPFPTIR